MTTPPLNLVALVDNCSSGYCLSQLSAGFCNLPWQLWRIRTRRAIPLPRRDTRAGLRRSLRS